MFNPREATTSIEDLGSLIQDHVRGRVLKHEVRPLTDFGENYGSEMVRVEITVQDEGKEEIVHTVAKLIPPTDMQMEIFNTQVTFKNEIAFYAEIVPTLKHFQKEQGMDEILDYFAKLYGARINLKNNDTEVDKNAIILMENLKAGGYQNLERHIGFDLNTTKLILRTFANFQATVVALKDKRPDLFQSKILPYVNEWIGTPPPMELHGIVAENPSIAHLTPRVVKLLKRAGLRVKKIREPWATVTHNDAWVNNIMLKVSNDEEITGIKLVDFQIFDHSSFANDLIFFLFSSVQIPVLKYHFDKLLRYYYDEFILTLQKLKVSPKKFTYESFLDEIKIEAPFQVFHSMFMLPFIFGPKGKPKMPGKVREWNPTEQIRTSELSNEALKASNDSNGSGEPGSSGKGPIFKLSPECKEKICYMVEESARRKWL